MEFTGTFTIGKKEVSLFTRRVQLSQKKLMLFILTALGMVCGNFVLRMLSPGPGFMAQVGCSLLGGAGAFALFYGMIVYSIAKGCNSEYVAGRRWTYTQTLTINPLGVTCVTDEGKESHADFDELLVEECPEAFYIFVSEESAWILPKKQLSGGEAEEEHIRGIFKKMAEPERLNLRRVKG